LNSGAIGWTDYPAAISNSRRDTQKAVELDANLADGYRGLSRIQAIADSNCRAAETTLKRAMELAPGSADNMETAAFIANCLGREEEAIGFVQQALALDPIVAGPYRLLAQYLRNLGRYDEAHGALAKALDLNPQELWIHETQGEVYLAQGRPPEALAEMEQEAPGCLHDFGMAIAFHALGRHEQSDSALASLISRYSSGSAYQIAQVYAYRGEVDKAFEWLTRAYQQHDGGLCLTKTDLLLKSLRGDSRYEQLLRTLNLAD
jgi:tetratricopeptide (TPR) repeat protein